MICCSHCLHSKPTVNSNNIKWQHISWEGCKSAAFWGWQTTNQASTLTTWKRYAWRTLSSKGAMLYSYQLQYLQLLSIAYSLQWTRTCARHAWIWICLVMSVILTHIVIEYVLYLYDVWITVWLWYDYTSICIWYVKPEMIPYGDMTWYEYVYVTYVTQLMYMWW